MDRAQAIGILEASNRLLLEEMAKLRKLLEAGCSTADPEAPYTTLEKCELEYAAVQIAVETMRTQAAGADQTADAKPPRYILRSDFKPEDVRIVPFSVKERQSNYQANLAKGLTLEENEISGIVVADLDDLVAAYKPDPIATILDVLESKLIGTGMDNTSYRFVGVTRDGSSILIFVKGIDYEIADYVEADDTGADEL